MSRSVASNSICHHMCNSILDGEKKSFSLIPKIGSSVNAIVGVYNKLRNKFISRIQTTVVNYGKWPLSSPRHRIEKGTAISPPRQVLPGYEEAWAAEQTLADGVGTKGITAWKTAPGRSCFYYWYVEHNFIGRAYNEMAIGCVPEDRTINY